MSDNPQYVITVADSTVEITETIVSETVLSDVYGERTTTSNTIRRPMAHVWKTLREESNLRYRIGYLERILRVNKIDIDD